MPSLLVIIASTRPGRVGKPIGDWFVERARDHGGFDVAVADLLELTPKEEMRFLAGQRRTIYSYAHRGPERERLIWGLTGTVVADLLATLRPLL